MGFTTGFVRPCRPPTLPFNSTNTPHQLGGITLTTTLLYLSLNLHTRNRVHQAALLHQQSLLLTNIVEPRPPLPPPTSREVRTGIWESAKDRWNAELEGGVRKLQRTDWGDVRDRMEEGVGRVWRRAFAGAEEGVKKVEGEVKGR